MSFAPYVERGWKLCALHAGEKRPRGDQWNSPERALTAERVERVTAAGLMHAYSGTCAFDLDNVELSRAYFMERGVDLDALLSAPDSVHISSGTPNRGKLLFALDEPLPTKRITQKIGEGDEVQAITLFELRCATASGKSAQDVLPPSRHPSGRTYEWCYADDMIGDWRALPQLPPQLHALWLQLLGNRTEAPIIERTSLEERQASAQLQAAQAILDETDPDTDHDTWLHLGMALEHDLGEPGWSLWLNWSAKGKKYPGERELGTRWESFGKYTGEPITLNSFKRRTATVDEFDIVTGDFDPARDEANEEQKRRASIRASFIPAGQYLSEPAPDPIVENVLPKTDEAVNLIAESGGGKSAVAMHLACAVADPRVSEWFGNRVIVHGPVIYLCAEAYVSSREYLRAVQLSGWYPNQEVDPEKLEVPPSIYVRAGFNVSDAVLVEETAAFAKEIGAVLIINDTMRASTPGLKENSDDMKVPLEALQRIARASGATPLNIHHLGKNAALGASGWAGIKGGVDGQLLIEKLDNGTRMLSLDKVRVGGGDPRALLFTTVGVVVGKNSAGGDIVAPRVQFIGKAEADAAPKSKPEPVDAVAHELVRKLRDLPRLIYNTADAMLGADGTDSGSVDELRARVSAQLTGDEKDKPRRVDRSTETLVAKGLLAVREGKFWMGENSPFGSSTEDSIHE